MLVIYLPFQRLVTSLGILMPPGLEKAVGKENVALALRSIYDSGSVKIELNHLGKQDIRVLY